MKNVLKTLDRINPMIKVCYILAVTFAVIAAINHDFLIVSLFFSTVEAAVFVWSYQMNKKFYNLLMSPTELLTAIAIPLVLTAIIACMAVTSYIIIISTLLIGTLVALSFILNLKSLLNLFIMLEIVLIIGTLILGYVVMPIMAFAICLTIYYNLRTNSLKLKTKQIVGLLILIICYQITINTFTYYLYENVYYHLIGIGIKLLTLVPLTIILANVWRAYITNKKRYSIYLYVILLATVQTITIYFRNCNQVAQLTEKLDHYVMINFLGLGGLIVLFALITMSKIDQISFTKINNQVMLRKEEKDEIQY